jgi:hypothetical protein
MSGDPRPRPLPATLGARSDRDDAPTRLAPCPCGEDAVWYRVTPPETPRAGRALAPVNAAESGDNLCDACFPLAIPPEGRAGWARLNAAFAPPRRPSPGEEDQDRRHHGGPDAFSPSPLPDDW